MITLASSADRSFTFPADLPTVYTYYTDLSRILTYLPHIYIARSYEGNQFRVCYNSIELGAYKVNIFCDLLAQFGVDGRAFRIIPLEGALPVKTRAGLRSITAPGRFTSESLFFEDGEHTRIDYHLELQAKLPVPFGLRFAPGAAINSIAGSITRRRIKEIADGFIERSIDAFPDWLEELEQSKPKRTP